MLFLLESSEMVALFFYAKKGGFSMKNQSYLSVYKCNEFRVVSNEFIGRIEDTPENISAFVVSADFNSNYALVDDMDTVKVFTIKCLNVVYENEKRESQMQEKIMQFHFNLEFVNKKYKNADVVLKVWATEICREQGLSDYYPVQDVKDAFKTMEYIDEKEAVEIVLNDSEETLIYHKSPEEEYFTREALKHETINFDKESEIEEDLDELEK